MIFREKLHSLRGFTLTEIMVAIGIISIIFFGATQVNFNRVSDKQKLDIFTNQVVSKIETVRNNALIGKGVGASLETPDRWTIEVSSFSLGSMQTSYFIGGSGSVSSEYSMGDISSPYEISLVNCIQLDETTESLTATGTISIQGNDISISGCSNDNYKILEIVTAHKSDQKSIRINSLSGLIEVD